MADETWLPDPARPVAARPVGDTPVTEPVEYPAALEARGVKPRAGMGLCLSGGGYRAMLFHLGVLWRLNEFALLPKCARISSVSGGSITSAFLALQWDALKWLNGTAVDFKEKVADPICRLADHTIDVKSGIAGLLLPGQSISDRIIKAYSKHLFGKATLQNLPDDTQGKPVFVINATNVQSGAIFRFTRRYMADYRVGRVDNPAISLALAVAASSAFPPVLSPTRLKLPAGAMKAQPGADLNREPFTTNIVLTDGGVYDNLGLETVWKRCETVIVSDGGGQMQAEAEPHSNWAQHSLRINGLIDNQVRALRKRQIVTSLIDGARHGTYFRMRGDIASYAAPGRLDCPFDRTSDLAATATRLAELPRERQERIINWGYALADAAVRAWVDTALPAPAGFPFPRGV